MTDKCRMPESALKIMPCLSDGIAQRMTLGNERRYGCAKRAACAVGVIGGKLRRPEDLERGAIEKHIHQLRPSHVAALHQHMARPSIVQATTRLMHRGLIANIHHSR